MSSGGTVGFDELKAKLDGFGPYANVIGILGLEAGAQVFVGKAIMNVGSKFRRRTGDLINSIKVYDSGLVSSRPVTYFGSKGVVYAKIHEFGGIIKPKRAKMLHWVNDAGEDVFAKQSVIPARPYLRPAVDEGKEQASQAIAAALDSKILDYFRI